MNQAHAKADNTAAWTFWRSRIGLTFPGFLAIAAFFPLTEHPALGALPLILLALCPLVHLFGHGGHGYGAMAKLGGRR
ncbi:hypothetical protein SVA_3267 [Sulfurifustis variabilis]|uniref:DUF2933 domain-containing protein n=1 Tax=Sulfurifustis variabilis TaxID=1675686 RepID=A0A1C7AF18_9GAMM|nr:DUF2933 domain-containing protein [Sulfurifustis variabilis]BAU49815.1 hypothetical protein SVA_3267 [Sulfurifustis variabilis]